VSSDKFALDLADLDVEPLTVGQLPGEASLESLTLSNAMTELAASCCGAACSCCVSCCCCCC
jgi:hypothetical protein